MFSEPADEGRPAIAGGAAPTSASDDRPRTGEGSRAAGEGLVVAAIVVGLLIAVPWLAPSYRFLSVAISTGIATVALYGLSVLFGQAGILSVGHAALMGVGAYTAAILANDLGMGFWSALPFAMAASALVAGLLGLPSLRVSGHHFIIITFAFGALFSIVLTNGGSFTGAATGLDVGPIGRPFGINLDKTQNYYLLVVGAVLLSILATQLIASSAYGRTLRAIRENEPLARSIGINTGLHKLGAFMVSGLFAGAAGILEAYYLRHISPTLYGAVPERLSRAHGDAGRPAHALRPLGRRDHRELPAGGPEARPGRCPDRLRHRPDRGHHAPAGRPDRRPDRRLPMAREPSGGPGR